DVFGFVMDAHSGSILPATAAAEELWELGLSNHQKFHVNSKPETQLVSEALELPYARDHYSLALSSEEELALDRRRALWSAVGAPVIGINTGCSPVIPYKKLSVEFHREMVRKLTAMNLT